MRCLSTAQGGDGLPRDSEPPGGSVLVRAEVEALRPPGGELDFTSWQHARPAHTHRPARCRGSERGPVSQLGNGALSAT